MGKGLYKRGNVWWLTYKDINEKVIRESSKLTKYKDAEILLQERRKAIREGKEPEPIKRLPNYNFGQLAAEYDKWCERQRSYRTKKRFISQLVNTFGNIQLKHLNTKLIEQFQTERIQKGNKPATINRLLATLKHCIHKGYQWEMLSEETFRKVRQVKLLQENNRRLRYLSQEECQSLINASTTYLKPIVITALNTGMRKEEILSLQWEKHIDLKHGFILLDITKSGKRREIPINQTLRTTLQGIVRRIESPYVFTDNHGNRFKEVKRSFASALKKTGIKDFRFHDLRHTFASLLIMNGEAITTIQELLGHESLTMTLRYAHLAPGQKVKALEILDKTLTKNSTSHLLHNLAGSQ